MKSLLKKMEEGATVITATQRLSRHLIDQYNFHCHHSGDKVWATPDALPWTSWLARTWTTFGYAKPRDTDTGKLSLLPAQELALWGKIIEQQEKSSQTGQLLHIADTAMAARDAWQLLRNWRLELKDLRDALSEDVKAFSRWAKSYEHTCRQRAWIDTTGQAIALCRLLTSMSAPECQNYLPGQLVISGFDQLSPLQLELIAALRFCGIDVQEFTASVAAPQVARLTVLDHQREIELAARWSRGLLEAGENGPIGIIVPDLNAVRPLCNRVFGEILQPGTVLRETANDNPPFHISLGEPLGRVAIVHAALNALGLLRHSFNLYAVGEYLRSPFFASGEAQFMQRARLDAELRRHGDEELDWTIVKNSLRALSRDKYFAETFVDLLEQIVFQWKAVSAMQSCEQWVEKFWDWLSLLGWCNGRELNSSEYQAVGAWKEILSQFMSLGIVFEEISLAEALQQLTRLANERVFQPKAEPASIQIMGLLEASGLTFSHLWIAGMDADVWPGTPRLNPFLPYALQRQHGFPHADAEVELAYANRVSRRLLDSAATVLVSSPSRVEDQSLSPSPLFATLPVTDINSLELDQGVSYAQTVHQHKPQLETLLDVKAPAIKGQTVAPGGVGLLKDQAACPFRGFARHRLHATAITQATPLLDAASRGVLIHQIMQNIWSELRSQATLRNLSPTHLQTLVSNQIQKTIYAERARHPLTFSKELVELEHARLMALVTHWLSIEMERAAFEVLEPEQEQLVEISGLKLRVRPDRIDCLSDGSLIVVDYKTGKVSIGDWFGERPDEPQLPTYLYALGKSVTGLAFASLNRDKFGYLGLSQDEQGIDGIKASDNAKETADFADWEQLVGFWRGMVEQLAKEFIQGHAVVDPNSNDSCRYCEVMPLCRIYEIEQTVVEETVTGELSNGVA